MTLRTFLSLLPVCALLSCQPPVIANAQEWAQKMFDGTSHDFGAVVKGSAPEYVFEIENCYEEEVVIDYFRSSCGCTKLELDTQKLKTWEKAHLKAKFDTLGFSGQREATISIGISKPYRAEVKLHVRGNILTDIQVFPGKMDFGNVALGNTAPVVVTLTRRNNPNFKIKDIRSSYSHIGVSPVETGRDRNGVTYQLKAFLKEDVPAGLVQGELNVIGQDGNNEIRIAIPFYGKITSPLEISPSVLTLTDLVPGQEIKKRIVLKGDQPFRVKDVTCENKAFSVNASADERAVHFVEITYTVPESVASSEVSMNFLTDLKTQPNISLPIIITAGQTPTQADVGSSR